MNRTIVHGEKKSYLNMGQVDRGWPTSRPWWNEVMKPSAAFINGKRNVSCHLYATVHSQAKEQSFFMLQEGMARARLGAEGRHVPALGGGFEGWMEFRPHSSVAVPLQGWWTALHARQRVTWAFLKEQSFVSMHWTENRETELLPRLAAQELWGLRQRSSPLGLQGL